MFDLRSHPPLLSSPSHPSVTPRHSTLFPGRVYSHANGVVAITVTCSAFNRCRGSFLSHDNVRGHLRPCALITRRSIRSRDRGEDDDPRRRTRIHPDHRLPFHARRNFGRNGIVDRSSMFKVLPMTEIFLNHASERNVVLLSFTNIPSFLSFLRPLLSLFLFFFTCISGHLETVFRAYCF